MTRLLSQREITRDLAFIRRLQRAFKPLFRGSISEKTAGLVPLGMEKKLEQRAKALEKMLE